MKRPVRSALLILLVAVVAVLVLAAIVRGRKESSAPFSAAIPPPKVKDTEEAWPLVDPALVIYTWGGVPVKMRKDDGYAVALINDAMDAEGGGIPRYVLAVEKTRTVVDTRDAGRFAEALKKLVPRDTTVFRYDTCLVGSGPGLRAEEYAQWEQMFRDAGLKVDEECRVTCTCP